MKIENIEFTNYETLDVGVIHIKVKGVQNAHELFTHIVNHIKELNEKQTATDGKENQ